MSAPAASDTVIVGVGMVTAIGLSARETAASARSATMRFVASNFRDHRREPITLAEVPDEGLPELVNNVATSPGLTTREMRLLRLGSVALRECLLPLAEQGVLPGVVLALPEVKTARLFDRTAFLVRLAEQTEGRFDLVRSDATHRGRAGGLAAIGQAAEQIDAGQASFVLAGGIDTYRDAFILGTLDLEKRVKSSTHLDGFIPGEGAAFLLLSSRKAAIALGVPLLAAISRVSVGMESGHLYSTEPYRGDGLALTMANLIQSGAVQSPIQTVYSSMNGENHWAKEWGVGYLRNRSAFLPDHTMHHPADCLGDTGAACGPLLVGLAALGIKNGYQRSPCLVYSSSDDGPRAALTVRAA
jgi:3-oxoacyl-[acyl-carrier-protein] synthase-1